MYNVHMLVEFTWKYIVIIIMYVFDHFSILYLMANVGVHPFKRNLK